MSSNLETFLKDSASKVADLGHRKTIQYNIGKYNAAVDSGMGQYANHELARTRASYLKTMVLENLDKYLLEFESNFVKRGGKVIWASDYKEAQREIMKIMARNQTRTVVKSKSMTTEEIHLNAFLEDNGIEAVETDLGEYIVQLAGQRPYHIVTPAMHMSKKDISELFHKKLKIPLTDDATKLTLAARDLLREKYTQAEVGITGANFLVADKGAIAITENEGNGRLTTSFPKVHIAVVGIEKVIPSTKDLDLFWPLLSTSGTGQQVTVYNTLLCGPKQSDEADGPEEMYVILLDNGRTDLLADEEKRQSLNCIRCGACLNACPVYRNIGGHSYETTYSGPIGSVISPHLLGMEEYRHLSYASTLCGACTSVCPVKIDLHGMLLQNRKQSVDMGMYSVWEQRGWKLWKRAMKSRRLMDLMPSSIKSKMVSILFKDNWGKKRSNLTMAPKSFNKMWKDRK